MTMLSREAVKDLLGQIRQLIEADRAEVERLEKCHREVTARLEAACQAKASLGRLYSSFVEPDLSDRPAVSLPLPMEKPVTAPSAGALAAKGHAALQHSRDTPAGEQTSPQVVGAGADVDAGLAAPQAAASAGGGRPKPPAARANRWTSEDDAKAKTLARDGKTHAEIGRVLGRTAKAVAVRLGKLRAADPDANATAPKPAARAAGVHPSSLERAALAHYEGLEPDHNWAVADDIQLIALFGQGWKAATVAVQMERGWGEVIARFKQLIPMPTADTQSAMLAVLRRKGAGDA